MAREKAFVIPTLVTSPSDIGRLLRELSLIDDALLQLSLRKGGSDVKMPKTSRLMDELIDQNKLNLLQEEDRAHLKSALEIIRTKAPVLHMSFSADPSVTFMEKLVTWLRTEIHPMVLVTVGLQPTIGAGCVVRSTNQHFDLTLRQDFVEKSGLLKEMLFPTEVPA